MDEISDWTTPLSMATLAAEELAATLAAVGLHGESYGDDDGEVCVIFASVQDAESFMILAFQSDPFNSPPGTLYDRATEGCVTMSNMAEDVTQDELDAALKSVWKWRVHPHLIGRRMTWHARVYIPAADAVAVTASLNNLRNGGAL